ncbi:DUF1016 N-terminal domain-containing protein [Lolliginicoccus lacisalsi]|uniref:DUF1016 N-terminal domain-containing protein n=1 Tax=Lolliginicoccus lacisalsi TaxID=2742202 RepID=UPI001CDC84CE|nr:DUF1016 N-terminal domain-containing protein [Lolliginicoccus lacisalsi]
MSDKVPALVEPPEGYSDWLAALKAHVHAARQRAAVAVNTELVQLYWQIGREILGRQAEQGWGAKVIDRLSHDLRDAFPDMRGFSSRNLKYMRAFAASWPSELFVQQVAAQIPWGHNMVLLDRLKEQNQRVAYARAALEHGWSRRVLEAHIKSST